MSVSTDPARAREHLLLQQQRVARLRGDGPNPFDYDIWAARTEELLTDIYGAESAELARYHDASSVPGRLPGVRGQAGNMTLNIHGQWGILGRLDRAEALLHALIGTLPG